MTVREIARILRRMIGAPDYDAYVAHLRQFHPDSVAMSAREYRQRQLELRYNRPGSRCC